ncbi:MAG: hypothetical protein JKY37_09960 [Nannocystaceae bacterium]|nr:hypothetical protein [Nannocystaceae bacterium]
MQHRDLSVAIVAPIFALTSLLAGGCIDTKDMSDTDDGQGSSTGVTNSAGSTGVTTATESSPPSGSATSGQVAESGSDGGSGGSTTGGPPPTGTSIGDTTSSDTGTMTMTTGGSGSGSPDQALCEETDGTWDMTACGHYVCGAPNGCQAAIPGCDCGPSANFVEDIGCVEDDACATAEFACGDSLDCTVDEDYCEEFIPGVKGADPSYTCTSIPAVCLIDPTCACLAALNIPGLAGDCSGEAGVGITVTLIGA